MTSFLLPKVNSDEDAPPIDIEVRGERYVGVLDGLGGSGGRSYKLRELAEPLPSFAEHSEGDVQVVESCEDESDLRVAPTPLTGAYLASRAAAQAVETALRSDAADGLNATELRTLLAEEIRNGLSLISTMYESKSKVLLGGVVRAFPTTLALARVSTSNRTTFEVDVFWAGDSRVYALDQEGLHQLTRDHARPLTEKERGDKPELPWCPPDTPMTNVIHLGHADIDHATVELVAPCVVFASSDGCFGYWPSTLHFELAVLRSACQSADQDEWTGRLQGEIITVTQDDASLALTFLGDSDFDQLRDLLQPRMRFLELMLGAVGPSDESMMSELWKMYQWGYERYLPALVAASAEQSSTTPSTTGAGGDVTGDDTAIAPVGHDSEAETSPLMAHAVADDAKDKNSQAATSSGDESVVTIFRSIDALQAAPMIEHSLGDAHTEEAVK